MKFKPSKKLIPHVAIIVVIGIGLLLTRDWPYETALFPRFGCIVVLGVAILSLVSELVRGRGHKAEQKDPWLASQLSGDRPLRRAGVVFGWLVLFVIGVWAFGYEFAAVTFVFLFMKIKGKQPWHISILFTAVSFAFVMLVFHLGLGVTWPHGPVWEILGL
jgi:hypothetical protein